MKYDRAHQEKSQRGQVIQNYTIFAVTHTHGRKNWGVDCA